MLQGPADRLYPIIDPQVCERHGLAPLDVAAACLDGGARMLQLRVKEGPSSSFLALAEAVVARARGSAIVIVNDRADIALMAGADGVHVGQDDVPPDAVRTMFECGTIGVSTHDDRQIEAGLASAADYIAVGPIYSTGTKDTGYSARGLDLVRRAAGRGKPVVAIGGIDLERAPDVIQAGASAVAVISDLLATGDVAARVRGDLAVLQDAR